MAKANVGEKGHNTIDVSPRKPSGKKKTMKTVESKGDK